MSTFGSMTISSSGMQAARAAMEIISNNVANANTPGYKRQAPILVEGNPATGFSVNAAQASQVTGGGVR
ncbi:MAG: flagellar basal body protein, partial [Armatimonadota bacterium]